jgi:hypothetical protein
MTVAMMGGKRAIRVSLFYLFNLEMAAPACRVFTVAKAAHGSRESPVAFHALDPVPYRRLDDHPRSRPTSEHEE